MQRRCIICDYITLEEGYSSNPYMCPDCEEMMIGEESRHTYLDTL